MPPVPCPNEDGECAADGCSAEEAHIWYGKKGAKYSGKDIKPDELVVEVQPPLSVEDSLDPDGKPFANLSMRQWGAQRHFGWRQNVRALWKANEQTTIATVPTCDRRELCPLTICM